MLFATNTARLTAVLGPTNTGKTYLAIERMLGHASGMIGFPLRLLARENYDRVVRQVGPGRVALVTGEEKILPPNPSYYVCTVESMPVERQVAFMAVDEVQMAADPERGHFFTQRLLSARGTDETMLLGSDTIRPILQRLAPDIEIVSRPRFSTLSYTGPKKITRLPRRSAVVGFSASEVYAMAELIRRQRGGAAIVMGALSPRTRNAQVEMFQSGEVDYLVATDAIGMGLNMDINHVAFAGLRKFDGRGQRSLLPAELAQIAGRAGRHMNDGTFGTTGDLGALDQETVEAIENHRFDPLKVLQWRNTDLDYSSVANLLRSLDADAPHAVLARVREQDDHVALHTLTLNPEIADRAKSMQRVHLLWDVCQIPDFRKTMAEEHLRLLTQIYLHLASSAEQLSEDWVDTQVSQLEKYEGDIDTLMGRIAHTRTWTYISHRANWLSRAHHWQERTRAIEDRLSDVLHEQLTQRFVDRRAAMLVRRMKDDGEVTTAVDRAGDVTVEGEYLGRIEGFRFAPDIAKGHHDQRTVINAALRALRADMPARLQAFATAADHDIVLDEQFRLVWGGGPVARLVASGDILAPKVEILTSDLLDGPAREILRKRTADWVEAWVARGLPDLIAARKAEEISPAVRGVVYQVSEKLGVMPRAPADEQLATFTETDRKVMARLGVRVGIYSLFLSTMLKPGALRMRALLWTIANHKQTVPPLPAEGRTSVELPPDADRGFWAAIGFMPLGDHAIRADMVERLAAMARQAVRESREAHQRAQHEKRAADAAARAEEAAARKAARAKETAERLAKDEINEWMIVAAALGVPEEIANTVAASAVESAAAEPEHAADRGADAASADAEDRAENAAEGDAVAASESAAEIAAREEDEPVEVSSPVCYADLPEARTPPPPAEAMPEDAPAPVDADAASAGEIGERPETGALPADATDDVTPAAAADADPAGDDAGDNDAGEARAGETADAPQHDAAASASAAADASAARSETPAADRILRARPKPAKGKLELPALPPGHFRATAEMLSLVGCSEPAMALVLRGLGYRVHQPSEETGSLHSFSLPPRFPREERRPRRHDDRRPRREGAAGEDARGDRPPRGERAPRPEGVEAGGERRQRRDDRGPPPGRRDDRGPPPGRRDGNREERRDRRRDRRHDDRRDFVEAKPPAATLATPSDERQRRLAALAAADLAARRNPPPAPVRPAPLPPALVAVAPPAELAAGRGPDAPRDADSRSQTLGYDRRPPRPERPQGPTDGERRRDEGRRDERPRDARPREDRPREDRQRHDRPREDRPREGAVPPAPPAAGERERRPDRGPPGERDRRPDRGPPGERNREQGPPRDNRGPRREPGGPAVRLIASTDKPPPGSDSPFAKLLELKFGNKK